MRIASLDAAVDLILDRAGSHAAVATPLGLGKPNHLLNALYGRIKADPTRSLTLYTALSLDPPQPGSELERRFLEPFLTRQFGADYPRLEYVVDLKANRLPPNVHVQEFYFQSGAMLHSVRAQRDYTSINYTQLARDLSFGEPLHAIVQLVARRGNGATARYSLSCNPDVTLDVLDAIAARAKPRPLMLAVVHPDLPFLGGDAEVAAEFFDGVLDEGDARQPLFALPRNPIDMVEYAIGLQASSLVRDGGTLQIGIGALSDAIVQGLLLRHRRNADYLDLLRMLGANNAATGALIDGFGGVAPFKQGLYGASEMVMDGFMHLRRAGILTRTVHDDIGVQRALYAGEALDPQRLSGGHYLKGAFFLGSKEFYAWLRELEGEEYSGLLMNRVSDVNQLYGGHEQLDRLQRRDARFFNTCMMASVLGAATSDALENGNVVSGVGGQYNFVAMAHALDGGRSVLLLRATHESGGKVRSNIRWNYGHTTIPRHLRDIYITEYGIADLRGQTDEACVRAMLAISDARFIDGLAADAMRNGKLPRDFKVPSAWRRNLPQHLADALAPCTSGGLLPRFPFDSEFNAVEQRLLAALLWLKKQADDPRRWLRLGAAFAAPGRSAQEIACLDRLGLGGQPPRSLRGRVLARIVRAALARTESAQ